MRLTIPCRALTCSHLQCFDATLYIQMNEKKPTWVCPVCDKKAPYEHLIIDGWVKLNSESKCHIPVWNWGDFLPFFNSFNLISLLLVKNSWPAPSDSPSCKDFVLLKAKVIIMKAILGEFLCFPRCKQHTLYFLLMEQLYKSGRVDKRQSK